MYLSHAAVALLRSFFFEGADFTAAMEFQLASANLAEELGISMIILPGRQYALAEFIGAPLMIAMLVFRRWLDAAWWKPRAGRRAKAGSMEGYAEMDMSVTGRLI